MSDLATKRAQLLDLMQSLGSCAVAFSAGVDSSVVAKAARAGARRPGRGRDRRQSESGGGRIGGGPPDGPADRDSAPGNRHGRTVAAPVCGERARSLLPLQDRAVSAASRTCNSRSQVDVIVNGANADDLFDYRPGMRAATRAGGAQSAGRMRPDQERGAGAGRGTGSCRSGTSRPRPVCPAALPTAKR